MALVPALRNTTQLLVAAAVIVFTGFMLRDRGAEVWTLGALTSWLALVVILLEGAFLRSDSAPRIAAWALVALGGFMMREDWEELGWGLPVGFAVLAGALVMSAVFGRRPLAARDGFARGEGRPGAPRDTSGPRRRPGKRSPSRQGDEGTRPPEPRSVT